MAVHCSAEHPCPRNNPNHVTLYGECFHVLDPDLVDLAARALGAQHHEADLHVTPHEMWTLKRMDESDFDVAVRQAEKQTGLRSTKETVRVIIDFPDGPESLRIAPK